ncbi:MAG TPA: hypothetical protein DDY71_14075 [Spirochaetia bacterium]|nr:hypothetical protein [Spirochaetia bacterium]HBI38766.1 hypothetical protein [Spirochaetia bacterium]
MFKIKLFKQVIMTKVEVISLIQQKILRDKLKDKSEFTQKNIMLILDSFFDVVKDNVSKGEHIELRGFGTFETKIREPKKAINPRTKESIIVTRHAVPVFKPGKDLKELVRKLNIDNK